jgi:hypothetical protein
VTSFIHPGLFFKVANARFRFFLRLDDFRPVAGPGFPAQSFELVQLCLCRLFHVPSLRSDPQFAMAVGIDGAVRQQPAAFTCMTI